MARIAYLADHPEHILTLAEWFRAEWQEYYAGRTNEDVAEEFSQDLKRDRLPIRLIAFEQDELAGCIVLREFALSTHPDYKPGLGGLYVAKHLRGRGIGTHLVSAGIQLAWDLGYPAIYTTTNTASRIVERLEWERLGTINHHGEVIGLYRKQFVSRDE